MKFLEKGALAGATQFNLRINFYIDGYHSYLLSKKLVGMHLAFLDNIEQHYGRLPDIFDRKPSPEKLADLVTGLLIFAESSIVSEAESEIAASGQLVISKADVDELNNPYTGPLSEWRPKIASEGKTYVDPQSFGTVFCPRLDKIRLLTELNEFIETLGIGGTEYQASVGQLQRVRVQLERGNFDRTQRFYDALADEVGDVSQEGVLKLSRSAGRRPIEEKGVDGDLLGALASDAYKNEADVFVLLTNDSDHAPLAKRLVADEKRVVIIGYADRPSSALCRAVGRKNVLNLLTKERDFDFSPVWLRDEDQRSLSLLEDIRLQWSWWKSHGMVRA